MSRVRQFFFCLAAGATLSACAQTPPVPSPLLLNSSAKSLATVPPLPPVSPVIFFRQLLAMSPGERLVALTNRPPAARGHILAKVREYQQLDADARELRLRATELRWYLTPLLRVPAAARAERLAQVPEELRGLVQARLMQWDILPPPLQQEFLADDRAVHYFAHVEVTNHLAGAGEPQQISENVSQFFELTPGEKQQMLGTLSAAERVQMEKTLRSFEQLPAAQRSQCIRNYARFAGMSAAERAEFLKNAENWSRLTPKDRQTWRDLVTQVPAWPPMPTTMKFPPLPPHAPPALPRANVATNFK